MKNEYEKNVTLNVIHSGLIYLIWSIDKLGYRYMDEWRNEMNKWVRELEERYVWIK